MFGKDYPREYLPQREGEMRTTLCDISQAKEKIDYNPTIDLDQYIREWIELNK